MSETRGETRGAIKEQQHIIEEEKVERVAVSKALLDVQHKMKDLEKALVST